MRPFCSLGLGEYSETPGATRLKRDLAEIRMSFSVARLPLGEGDVTPMLEGDSVWAYFGTSGTCEITPVAFRWARASVVAFAHDSGLGRKGDRWGLDEFFASGTSDCVGRLKFLCDQVGMRATFVTIPPRSTSGSSTSSL